MWLGIDLGTSGVKSLILDDNGQVAAENTTALGIQRPHPNWSEQNPDDWWETVQASVRALPAEARAAVKAIGLSGQMHGAVLLDEARRPLRPAILWNDGRSRSQCSQLSSLAREHTGNLAMPGFTAPKLLWVRENEPEIFARTDLILLPKDYIRLLLTGEAISDMSDASGTLWLDIARRQWSGEMLAASGLSERRMPSLVEGSAIGGQLRGEVAHSLGLPIVPVAGGGGDQAAGAIGAGVIAQGDAFLSLGTSGVIFAAGDDFAPNPDCGAHAFCHALPDRWHVMSVMLSAAACLDWVARLTGFADVPSAIAAAQTRGQSNSTPIFLPYLSGERTPHNDETARGVFFSMTHDCEGADLVNAVLEGVAFGLRDGLDALSLDLDVLSVIGGGARSSYWAQILANALQVPLAYRDGASLGPALGAARLARLSVLQEPVDAVCTQPGLVAEVEPGEEPTERLARFRSLYVNLRQSFADQTETS